MQPHTGQIHICRRAGGIETGQYVPQFSGVFWCHTARI
jgi:hypothetical protein